MEKLIVVTTKGNKALGNKIGPGVWSDDTLDKLIEDGWSIKDYKCCADGAHYDVGLFIVVHLVK